MAFIDTTAVNVILPVLQSDFGSSLAGVQWVVESYQLALAALILTGGAMGDLFGRRRVFLIGVVLFALGSIGSGIATSLVQLIAARSLQGVGGAMLVPGSLSIITTAFDEQERGRAIGIWSSLGSLTLIIGPLLGGWLADTLSWRWIFFINVPIAAFVVMASLRWVGESRDENAKSIDWAGVLFATAALGGIVFGLIESGRLGFGSPIVIVSLIAGAAFSAAFVVIEARVANPMLPPAFFRSRNFSGANLLTFFLYGALGGALLFLPFNLIQVQGYSATQAGAANLPTTAAIALLSPLAGRFADRHGARGPLIVGPLTAAAGFLLLARPGIGGTFWQTFFPPLLLLGIGMGITVAPLTTTAMSALPRENAGVASGVNNAVARAAGLLMIAVFGAVVFQVFDHRLEQALRSASLEPGVVESVQAQSAKLTEIALPRTLAESEVRELKAAVSRSFVAGFRAAMIIASLLAAVSAAMAALLIRTDGVRHGARDSS